MAVSNASNHKGGVSGLAPFLVPNLHQLITSTQQALNVLVQPLYTFVT